MASEIFKKCIIIENDIKDIEFLISRFNEQYGKMRPTLPSTITPEIIKELNTISDGMIGKSNKLKEDIKSLKEKI